MRCLTRGRKLNIRQEPLLPFTEGLCQPLRNVANDDKILTETFASHEIREAV
jgi:hypothetical protein